MPRNVTHPAGAGDVDLAGCRVVYISHNSLATALVQSQVLPYLDGLRENGATFDLITFERGEAPIGPVAGWWPIRARPGGSLPAKALDIARGAGRAVLLGRRATLLHARSYVAAAVAAAAGALTRRPFIFDMRGFLPEEYVDAGYWTTRDIRYRALTWAEGRLLRAASEIVVLTEAAAMRLHQERRYADAVGRTPVTVIPCAVDLGRFRPLRNRLETPTLVYSGSLGSFYELGTMLEVYRAARDRFARLRFLIVTRSDKRIVTEAIASARLGDADIVVRPAEFAEMPGLVGSAHVGIALVRRAPSKLGSSAVKVAEYLAAGLPVVVNAGLGDIDRQVIDHQAGHVMPAYGPAEVADAGAAVVRLAGDAGARERARALAEREYDLAVGIARYAAVYARLAGSSTT